MELRGFFVIIVSQLFLGKIGSTSYQANHPNIENTVIFLQEKIKQMEDRMSSFELSLAVQDSQRGCLEDKNEILKKVSEVEMRCADVSARLQDAEVRFLKMDTHLLIEVQDAQEKSSEALDRMHLAEQEVANMLDSRTSILQVKMNETREMLNSFVASQHDTENDIRENILSSTEKLRHLNDSLSSRFEGLALKMRIFENTLLEIEKDYANISFVSKLDKSFQNLDKFVKTDIQSIQSERVKQLEERCALCNDVIELNKTLRSHSSQISDLLDIQNSCADPPILENGYPLLGNKTHLGRKNGTTVTYACRGNRTLVGSTEIVCRSGEWTGDLPVCMNSCNTEDLKGYDGLDIPMNMITEHSNSLSIRCREEYVLSSPSEILTCLNGTWNVSNNPCMKVCEKGWYGADCKQPCHCASGPQDCDIYTGVCTGGCSPGWTGQSCQIPAYFDDTFYLWVWTTGHSFYCYSIDNYRKIEFSRVLDTGTGEGLPRKVAVGTRSDYAFIFLYELSKPEQVGAFQCGYSHEGGSMNIVVQLQDVNGDLYFSDPFQVANAGDTVELKVTFNKQFPIRWWHNGVDIPSWYNKEKVVIQSVQTTDAGTYECFYEGQRGVNASALLRLTVRKCKKNLFGEQCDQLCPPCYNGGVCHDLLGVCICPVGFNGNNCEVACDQGRFGANCSLTCPDCDYSLFCKPDPFGCACAPGYKGFKCHDLCEEGWYGADCKQPCHCINGPQSCNIYTGVCTGGCSSGWTGQSCQIPVPD